MLRFGELRFGRVGPFCCPAALQQGNPLTSGCTWRRAALGPEGSTQTNAVRTPTVTWTRRPSDKARGLRAKDFRSHGSEGPCRVPVLPFCGLLSLMEGLCVYREGAGGGGGKQ